VQAFCIQVARVARWFSATAQPSCLFRLIGNVPYLGEYGGRERRNILDDESRFSEREGMSNYIEVLLSMDGVSRLCKCRKMDPGTRGQPLYAWSASYL